MTFKEVLAQAIDWLQENKGLGIGDAGTRGRGHCPDPPRRHPPRCGLSALH